MGKSKVKAIGAEDAMDVDRVDPNSEAKSSSKKRILETSSSDVEGPPKKKKKKDLIADNAVESIGSATQGLSSANDVPEPVVQPSLASEKHKKKHKKKKRDSSPEKWGATSKPVELEEYAVNKEQDDPSKREKSKKDRKEKKKKGKAEPSNDDPASEPDSALQTTVDAAYVKQQDPQPELAEPPKEKKRSKEKKKDKKSKGAGAEEAVPAPSEPKRKKKKRTNNTEFPDPEKDETLSVQAQKALEYAFSQFSSRSKWKFNKARQNWIIRNVWSIDSIPNIHLPLAIKYLSNIQGGSRDKLKQTCTSIIESHSKPVASPSTTTSAEPVKSILKTPTPTAAAASTPSQPKAGPLIDMPAPAAVPTVDHKADRAKAILRVLDTPSES